jgi:Ca-activated chloride channel family protein
MQSASIFRNGRARAGMAFTVVLSAGLAAAQTDVYRAGTDLVVLQVSVSDAHRRHVPGLRAENFTVFDEGVPQPVAVFATSDAPLDVMLLLDTSGSMELWLPVAKNAAADLVGSLRSDDRAGLILFDVGAKVAHPLSDKHESVIAAIRDVSPGGATALYESVYIGLHTLSRARRADDGVRRQALVVLTDGDDNASRIPFEQALDAARSGDVTIFTIMPGMPPPEGAMLTTLGWRNATVKFEMRQLAEDTGGRTFGTTEPAGLADVYEQIGRELRAQYWLAYAAGAGGPRFRRVSVRVKDPPGLLARTRTGYNAAPPAAAHSSPPAPARRPEPPSP